MNCSSAKGIEKGETRIRGFDRKKERLTDFQNPGRFDSWNDYKMEESVCSEDLDRLSELSQSLIFHILSFLPIRDVVSTTLLSKHWENLWTTLPYLNFTHVIRHYEPDSYSIRNFVNRTLISWKGTKLLKFIIPFKDHFGHSLGSDMNLWVRFAVEKKVEELDIHLVYSLVVMTSIEDVYWVPQCLNSCSSLKKLSLVGCNLRIHGSPAWNQLKSLRVDGFCFGEDVVNRILLGTPQLEEFELRFLENDENLSIQSTSLKKLMIDKYIIRCEGQLPLDTVLSICCPNLETLQISGVFYGKCLFTNAPSLTDVTLDFQGAGYYDAHGIKLLGETMIHMFSTFRNVERVTLSSSCFQFLRGLLKKNLFSPLPNVGFLKLECYLIELAEMVHLLGIFPNLKTLVIEALTFGRETPDINAENYSEFETNPSKSFLLQLKIIEIASDFYDPSIFRCIEFLLKHCSMLEKMVVRGKCIITPIQEHLSEVEETLLSMPRSSPTAKLIVNKNWPIAKIHLHS